MSGSIEPKPIALQLYSVREIAAKDLIGTLKSVAELGYSGVEFAGLYGVPASEVRAALDEFGLEAVSAHVPFARFQSEIYAVFKELHTLGASHVQIPWLPVEQRPTTLEDAKTLAATLNSWGAIAEPSGIALGYHNHDFEFTSLGDKTVFDVLVELTNANFVRFELDLGWVVFAGVDPLATLTKISGRMPLVHVKDVAAGSVFDAVPIGEGVLDWATLLPAAKAAGAQWFIVEQDNPTDPLAEVGRSHANLSRLLS